MTSLWGIEQREEMHKRWEGTFHGVRVGAIVGMSLQVEEEADTRGGSRVCGEGADLEVIWIVGVVLVAGRPLYLQLQG